ncbi:MAG: 16S rRNA (adenine(1518)-N(6)/adenine(1519)-N(6))-dimethyltransferase RsmA [Candidatus Magasanikbacteria bacterium]
MQKNLFKPSHLKELCKKYNLSPSKKYGQNYLISEGVIDKIIIGAELKKTDTVIEIGPGFGVLTFALAEKVKKVVAFEIEQKLRDYWEESKPNNLDIVWGNVLSHITYHISHITSYKVVANIPYQITSNILRTLLEAENKPESITVMVQKEVAERICAKPGDMSLLAISVQYYGEPKIVARVSKGNFWPSPKVDSAVLHINTRPVSASKHPACVGLKTRKHENTYEFDELFFEVVKAGFKNKRKQVWRNLSEGLGLDGGEVKRVLINVVGNEKVRAEDLSVVQWRNIVKYIYG